MFESLSERLGSVFDRLTKAGALSEARVRVDRFNFGPPVGFPVQFRVIGPEPQLVRETAVKVREIMRANPSARDPHLDWNEQSPSVRLVVDQDRARSLGLNVQDVAQTLQTLLSGATVPRRSTSSPARCRRSASISAGSATSPSSPAVACRCRWRRSRASSSGRRTRSSGGATAT